MNFTLSRTGLDRGFIYINREDRDLIPHNTNEKVNVIIDGKTSEHTLDKYGRLFGLKKWFRSEKIRSDTPILIIIKDDGIALRLKHIFENDTEQRLKVLALEILDMLCDNGDKIFYSEIEDLWDTFDNSKDLKLSQFKYYMSRERRVKKNWRVSVKYEIDGIKKKKIILITIENSILLVLSILSGFIGGYFPSLLS